MLDINQTPAELAAAPAPFIASESVSSLLDFTAEATAEPAVNPLRELMVAERMLLDAGTGATAYRDQSRTRSIDPAELLARRLREKRRQKAKQAARRLKASRS